MNASRPLSPDDSRHGTYAGYRAHQRHRIPPCSDCLRANLDYRSTRAVARCTVDGCPKPQRADTLCGMHYSRLIRNGSLDRVVVTDEQIADRFISKVVMAGPSDCWLWTGTAVRRYGQFTVRHRPVLAHRFAYELWVGPIPDGLTIDHVRARGCNSTLCVNPAHLEPVTLADNIRRAWEWRR